MGTYTKNLKLETPSYTDNADIPALAKKNNEIIDSEMIKRANGLDYNEQTGVLQLTGNNSKVGSPIQIKNNLPVTSMASGTELKVNNYKQLIKFTKEGKTEQDSYTGKNILDYITKLNSSGNGLTNVINDDGSITTSGKPSVNYSQVTQKKEIIDELEDGQTYTISQAVANRVLYLEVAIKSKDGTYTYLSCNLPERKSVTFTVDKNVYVSYIIAIQTTTTATFGNSSLTITNKYMLCKGTDTADSSFEPYVGATPSPNPDYPQEIENIRGVENIWFGGESTTNNGITFTKNADGSYDITGTATAEANCFNYINIANTKLKNGINYNLSINKLTNGKVIILTEAYANETWDSHVINALNTSNSFLTNKIINIKDNITRVRYGIRVEKGQTVNIKGLKIQLEEGSIAHNFVPNGSNYLQLENVGENILNIDETPFTVKKITSQGNVLYWSGYSGVNDFVKVKEKTTYKFSSNEVNKVCYIDYYDKNKNYLSRTGTAVDYFTTPENCKYIKFAINLELIPTNAQLREGTIIKPYEPYKKKIINIDLKGNELCSDKEQTLKDELIIENGRAKIIKKYNKVVLDGTKDIKYYGEYGLHQLFYYDFLDDSNHKNNNKSIALCNQYKCVSDINNTMNAMKNFEMRVREKDGRLYWQDDRYNNISDMKSWLSNNNMIICYELAEPEVVDLGKVDFNLIENSTLTCEEESGMQIDYLTISSNIFVQDSLDGNSSQKAPSVDAIKKYFGKKVYDKDANGWIKIEFFDHIEYVYTTVVNKTFNSGWGYIDNVPFPVGVSSLGDRILTSSVICTDAAIKLNAGQYHNGTQGIGINYTNSYETALTKECIYDFRILEYK
jgi:hypothetical protein|nr:MAG TPA: hypothetical protein [Caudoviricetes sp.]